MNNTIMVSVVCITYNQEDTVEVMLESILKQETSFEYEVIIHDDCSKDKTKDIIEQYAKLYPNKIIALFEDENQFSKGKDIFHDYVFPVVRGKYVAFCEGDDYWTDKNKLQKQFDALENNPKCTLCVHDVECVNKQGEKTEEYFPGIDLSEGVIRAKEYIEYEFVKKPWLFQTTSYFVKSDIVKKICLQEREFINKYPVGDLPIVLLCLQKGDCYYIKRSMSAYRKNSGGVLTKNKKDLQREIRYYERMIEGHKVYKEYACLPFKTFIELGIQSTEIHLHKLKGEYRSIDKKVYEKIKNRLSLKNKVLIKCGMIAPRITYFCYKSVRCIFN